MSSLLRPLSSSLRLASSRASASSSSTFAQIRFASSVVFIEHKNGKLNDSVLSAITAAQQVGGDVNAVLLATPKEADSVLAEVKKIDGLSKVFIAKDEAYEHNLAEVLAPALANFLKSQPTLTHIFSPHTSPTKNLFPRLSGLLSQSFIADIISLSHDSSDESTIFERPIYAGNAILKIKTKKETDSVRIVSVRTTGFEKASVGKGDAEVVDIEAIKETGPIKFISEELTISDRPDLSSASRVVSGGRALKSFESFTSILEPLADKLNAAIGASRAAVDSGYADNSLQIGQTGKVVAPELYIAVGISGAIQHLAGMKESKLIVAINKDPDAPIFQVADVGIVGDLFELVPELTEKLQKA